jgi:hypothetical protein
MIFATDFFVLIHYGQVISVTELADKNATRPRASHESGADIVVNR